MPIRKIEDPILLQHARENRHNATLSEAMVWRALRNRRLCELKFRRQYIIDPYIVDFYCVEHKLVIEIDGSAHDGQEQYDFKRQNYLELQGHNVIRFPAERVASDLSTILKEIASACGIENPRI